MGKYEALGAFLEGQPTSEVRMTFPEIENVIGTPLPASSKKYPAWWSNSPSNNVMTKVWLEAGFQTEQVDVPGCRLVFRRVRGGPAGPGPAGSPKVSPKGPRRHPVFGCMAGLMSVAPGVDLTSPADPSWGSDR